MLERRAAVAHLLDLGRLRRVLAEHEPSIRVREHVARTPPASWCGRSAPRPRRRTVRRSRPASSRPRSSRGSRRGRRRSIAEADQTARDLARDRAELGIGDVRRLPVARELKRDARDAARRRRAPSRPRVCGARGRRCWLRLVLIRLGGVVDSGFIVCSYWWTGRGTGVVRQAARAAGLWRAATAAGRPSRGLCVGHQPNAPEHRLGGGQQHRPDDQRRRAGPRRPRRCRTARTLIRSVVANGISAATITRPAPVVAAAVSRSP